MNEYESRNNDGPASEKQWRMIENLLSSSQQELRRNRRWGLVKFFVVVFLFVAYMGFLSSSMRGVQAPAIGEPHTALVEINGVIAEGGEASADRIVTGLRDAFEAKHSKAVVLRINSPGGSPVQSDFVYQEIQRLRDEYPEKKLYAAITDVGASGAYYIASAADEIHAGKASIVGSIGVIMASFGFDEAIDKLGVDRRVYTAGENKALLDPFKPVDPKEKAHVKDMLNQIHAQFINAVREGRGDRLVKPDENKLFSGLFWTGEKALELGLVDGLNSPGQVARDLVGEEEIVDYTHRRSPFQQFLRNFGASIGAGLAEAVGARQPSLR